MTKYILKMRPGKAMKKAKWVNHQQYLERVITHGPFLRLKDAKKKATEARKERCEIIDSWEPRIIKDLGPMYRKVWIEEVVE